MWLSMHGVPTLFPTAKIRRKSHGEVSDEEVFRTVRAH